MRTVDSHDDDRRSDGERACFGSDLIAESVAHNRADRHQARIGDGEVGGGSVRTAGHDASVVQDSKVLRDIGLTRVETVDDLADVEFAFVEQDPDDRKPRSVTEHAKAVSYMFE